MMMMQKVLQLALQLALPTMIGNVGVVDAILMMGKNDGSMDVAEVTFQYVEEVGGGDSIGIVECSDDEIAGILDLLLKETNQGLRVTHHDKEFPLLDTIRLEEETVSLVTEDQEEEEEEDGYLQRLLDRNDDEPLFSFDDDFGEGSTPPPTSPPRFQISFSYTTTASCRACAQDLSKYDDGFRRRHLRRTDAPPRPQRILSNEKHDEKKVDEAVEEVDFELVKTFVLGDDILKDQFDCLEGAHSIYVHYEPLVMYEN